MQNTTGQVCMTDTRQSPNNEGRTYRYEPFKISFWLPPPGNVIIPYIFDTDLPHKSLQPRQFYLALTCKDLSTKSLKVIISKFKETYMPNFKNCDSSLFCKCLKIMTSLDIVLTEDIATASTQEFCFTALPVKLNECAPRQANGYDCGLFVCMFMRQSYPQTADMKKLLHTRMSPLTKSTKKE
ncbi:hypothetical protein ACOSQ4_017067 [Xanthoceras sorbifolium]